MVEREITVEDIAKDIISYAHKHGEDSISTWDNWLLWMCEGLEAKHVIEEGIKESFERMMNDNPDFFEMMRKWFVVANRNMRLQPGYDAFGKIYESCFKSTGKMRSGQFFTPEHICDLMARICVNELKPNEDGIFTYNDCAVGSGRTLLAAWANADHYAKNFFEAGDIDTTSVRMCALNFLINGMVGCVSWQDAMSQEWRFGYVVNACKVPFANDMTCLQFYTDKAEFDKSRATLLHLMKDWNVGEFRPKEDKEVKDEEGEEDSGEEAAEGEEAVVQGVGTAVQGELF